MLSRGWGMVKIELGQPRAHRVAFPCVDNSARGTNLREQTTHMYTVHTVLLCLLACLFLLSGPSCRIYLVVF